MVCAERLYDLYPRNYPCKILLCENYRYKKSCVIFLSLNLSPFHFTPKFLGKRGERNMVFRGLKHNYDTLYFLNGRDNSHKKDKGKQKNILAKVKKGD